MFIASDIQEVSWASLIVFPVYIVSLVLVEVYLKYATMYTFKMRTYRHIFQSFWEVIVPACSLGN